MATYAWDVPGYVQGHRFASDRRYWDPVTGRFSDRAGYDHLGNHCEVVLGSPAFSLHGARSREGMLIDNTCHLKFIPSIPWEGTMLMVLKPTYVAANLTTYLYIWGTATAEASNGTIRSQRASSVGSLNCATPSGALTPASVPISPLVSGNIYLAAFSTSQETRKMYWTRDGITVSESPSPATGPSGSGAAMGSVGTHGPNLGDIGGISSTYVRLGDLVGDGLVAPMADTNHIFEHHMWKGNVLSTAAPQMAAFIASLKSYYGIP